MKSSTFCWKNEFIGLFTQNVDININIFLSFFDIHIFKNGLVNIDVDIFKNGLIDIDISKNGHIDIDIFKNGHIDIDIFNISNTPTWPSPNKSQGKAKGIGKKKAWRACKTIGEESGKGVAEIQGKNGIHWIDLYHLSWLNSFLISTPKWTT